MFSARIFLRRLTACIRDLRRYGFAMTNLTLKGIPEDLRAQLEQEAAANFRNLDQEIMARLQRTFEAGAAQTRRDQRLIDEALASGPEAPLTEAEMDAVRDRVLKRKAA